jgi:hypothetical protein
LFELPHDLFAFDQNKIEKESPYSNFPAAVNQARKGGPRDVELSRVAFRTKGKETEGLSKGKLVKGVAFNDPEERFTSGAW